MDSASNKFDEKLLIMRVEPVLIANGQETPIPGLPGCLFRLLILEDGKTVTKKEIASLNNTDPAHVQGKIRDLRRHLIQAGATGQLVETNERFGYHANIRGRYVDAKDFSNTVEKLPCHFDVDSERPVDEAEAQAAITQLERALELWQANPGLGLDGFDFERKFAALKLKAERRLIKARLSTKNDSHIRLAILDLVAMSRHDDVEQWVWKLLLLAHHAMFNRGSVSHTAEDIHKYYKGKIPPALQKLMADVISDGDDINPFRASARTTLMPLTETRAAPEQLSADTALLQQLCRTLGITSSSQLKLEGSHLAPLACIRRTRARLYFSGVLASKWVNERSVRTEFKQLLARLDDNGGEAKFLMINPLSPAFERLRELRSGTELDLASVDHLRRLMSEHPSLQVRVFDNLPAFRIVVIDDDIVSFSTYRLATAAYATTDRGWETPHVALDPLAPYPLAEAFELLFKETWANSKDLKDISA